MLTLLPENNVGRLIAELASRYPGRLIHIPKLNPPDPELRELIVDALHMDDFPEFEDRSPDFDWYIEVNFDGDEVEFWTSLWSQGLGGGDFGQMWRDVNRMFPKFFSEAP